MSKLEGRLLRMRGNSKMFCKETGNVKGGKVENCDNIKEKGDGIGNKRDLNGISNLYNWIQNIAFESGIEPKVHELL